MNHFNQSNLNRSDINDDTRSLASQSTMNTINTLPQLSELQGGNNISSLNSLMVPRPTGLLSSNLNQNLGNQAQVEILPLSNESRAGIQKHEEILRRFELQKAARSIQVPTSDKEVKLRLRELKKPICLFGETAEDRRERLKNQMAKILLETGQLPTFEKRDYGQYDQVQKDEENDFFYYPGQKQLIPIRQKILQFSLYNSAERIQRSKIYYMSTVDEDHIINMHLNKVNNFEQQFCLFGDQSIITKSHISPNDQYFANSCGSGICQVWNIPLVRKCQDESIYQKISILRGHAMRVNDIKFNPKSTKSLSPNSYANLASCSSDNDIRFWTLKDQDENLESMEIEGYDSSSRQKALLQDSIVLSGHEDRVNQVLFHQLGDYLFSCSHDTTFKFWDVQTRQCIYTQTGHTTGIYSMALHPDGSLLFTGDQGAYGMIWDLRSGKSIIPILGHVKQIICADFSSNGYQLATGSDDNTCRIWDLRKKECQNIIPAHKKLISDVKFQPNDSRFLVTSSFDNDIHFWNTQDMTLFKTLSTFQSKITSVNLSSDSKFMISTSQDRKWSLWS